MADITRTFFERCAVVAAWGALAVIGGVEVRGMVIVDCHLEISGDWTEAWCGLDGENREVMKGEFRESGPDASWLGVQVNSAPYGWGCAGVEVGSFHLNLWADSAPGSLDYDWGIGAIEPTGINIQATATTRFLAVEPFLRVQVAGYARFNYGGDEQDVRVILRDVTSSRTLLDVTASADWSAWSDPGYETAYVLTVDAQHDHELVVSGWITSWDAKHATLEARLNFTPIPEPGTRGLLGLAFGFLLWRGCRSDL